jgi:hypothetical protein
LVKNSPLPFFKVGIISLQIGLYKTREEEKEEEEEEFFTT